MEIEVTQELLDNVRDIVESDDFVQDLLSYTTDPVETMLILQILNNGLSQLKEELNND